VPGSENVAEQTRGGAMQTYSCTIYIYSRLYLKKNRNIAVDTTTDTDARKLKKQTVITQIFDAEDY
jgi:hypothetical protein